MKHLLLLVVLVMAPCVAFAVDWESCVKYWYSVNVSTNVPHTMNIVSMEGNNNAAVEITWKIEPHPTKQQLITIEPLALAWKSNQVAEAAANIDAMEVKNVLRALVKTINLRLPSGQKITEAELKAAIKEELK